MRRHRTRWLVARTLAAAAAQHGIDQGEVVAADTVGERCEPRGAGGSRALHRSPTAAHSAGAINYGTHAAEVVARHVHPRRPGVEATAVILVRPDQHGLAIQCSRAPEVVSGTTGSVRESIRLQECPVGSLAVEEVDLALPAVGRALRALRCADRHTVPIHCDRPTKLIASGA